MSTVVVVRKQGIACIAADSLTTFGEQKKSPAYDCHSDKIQSVGDGAISIVGSAAHALVIDSVVRNRRVRFDLRDRLRIFESFRALHAELKDHYFLNPKESEEEQAPYESSRIDALVAHEGGIFGVYALREVYEYRRFWAIGSGAEYALGAMHARYDSGDDAEAIARAGIEAGAEFDTGSALPLTARTFTLSGKGDGLMFTGLVEGVGRIARIDARGGERRLRIEPPSALLDDLGEGDSIAVAGVCLTVVEPDASGFRADVSAETLACTTLGERVEGDGVNLERALLPTTRLGGHLVAGHVDGVGAVLARAPEGSSWRLRLRVPEGLARYVAPKGSICIDGISLTVNEVDGAELGVNIVPHTMAVTTLADVEAGTRVNVEVDVIARYLERLLGGGDSGSGGVSRELLARTGFLRG